MIGMQSYRWIYQVTWLVLATTVALGTLAIMHLVRVDRIPRFSAASPAAAWPEIDANSFGFDATVFKKMAADPDAVSQGTAAKRFRLAGTFFAVGGNQQARKAILDDLPKKEQLLVTEGDLIGNEIMVLTIMSDRIILRSGATDEQILLCFAGNNQATGQVAAAATAADRQALENQNRFGKRVGDKRWVMTRSELLNYYKEVLGDTDRLAKIYDSLKPVYQGQNIAGYTLVVEGEADMFTSFGLKPGDVIRQVNSMPMTSQTRAEYFINEFVKNRANGFVLDIERSGRKEKLVYMIR